MSKLSIIQCCFLIIFTNLSLFAQLDVNAPYDRITTYDGLASDYVRSTFQDKQGYIWIATSKGLDRFDGKNIKHFSAKLQDSTSLIDNHVLTMITDKNDRLWIATRGGLCIKKEDDTFIQFPKNSNNKSHLPHKNITALFKDSKDRIWVGTQNGLCLYNETSHNFQVFQYDEQDNSSIALNSIEDIFEDSKGNIWASTWTGGISIVDEKEPNKIQFKRLNLGTKSEIGSGCFPNFFEDKMGRVWTHKNDGQLIEIRFPRQKSILECDDSEINFVYHDLEIDGSIYQIHSFEYLDNGSLILSTNHGLKTIKHDFFAKDDLTGLNFSCKDLDVKLNFQRCHSLRKDKLGITWVSTNNGLYKLLNDIEGSISKRLKDFCSLNGLEISSLCIDNRNNNKWIGTKKGLYLFDQKLETFEKISLNKAGDDFGGISSIHQDYNGSVWIGTYVGKLFNFNNGLVKEYFLESLTDYNKRNIIWDILLIDGRLWLSTDLGLLVYDTETKEYQELFAKDTPGLQGDNVFDVIQSEDNSIWVAYMGGGLTKVFIDENNKLRYEQKSKGLNSNLILDMDLVGDNIWLATVGGVQRYNIPQDSFYSNDLLKSKATGTIVTISHDKDNNIWFASSNGLNYFDTKKEQLSTFNTFDGVLDNLSLKCKASDKEGNIYFGGSGGLNVFKPQDLIKEDAMDKIIFTNLMIENESVIINKKDKHLDKPILTSSIQQTDAITLSQKHINIRFDFAIPDFLNPYMYEFSYKIENLTPNWVNLNNNNSINITNFAKGDYNLLIKATDSKGNSYKIKELKIEVLPYFWQKWWFILSCLIGTVLAILYLIKRRESSAKAQKELLEAIVEDRTIELKTKNEKLQNYIQSNVQLEQFAHAAAHDLKSPMRTITSFIGLIKRRLKDRLSEDEAGYIEHIENGTKRLIKLVDDMLSFAKIKSDNLALEDKNPKVLVENILDQLAVSIQEKNAIVTIHSDVENVHMDEIKIGRVIQNLIANALKFVPKDKQPIIDISIDDFENDTKFSIRDNGIGISEESQKVVFDVFKRVAHDSAYDGTGMGLAVCKKIVEHHSGKIWIDSTEGVGSTFVFTIPKKHKPELEYAD